MKPNWGGGGGAPGGGGGFGVLEIPLFISLWSGGRSGTKDPEVTQRFSARKSLLCVPFVKMCNFDPQPRANSVVYT